MFSWLYLGMIRGLSQMQATNDAHRAKALALAAMAAKTASSEGNHPAFNLQRVIDLVAEADRMGFDIVKRS